MTNGVRKALSPIILILFGCWVVYIIKQDPSRFKPLLQVSPVSLAVLSIIFSVQMVLSGYYLRDVLKLFDIQLKLREWISLPFVSGFLNLTLPARSGTGFRAIYVHARYAFPLSSFVAAFLIYNLVFVSMHGTIGIVSVLFRNQWNHSLVFVVLVGFSAASLALPISFFLVSRVRAESSGYWRYFLRTFHTTNEMRLRPGFYKRTATNIFVVVILTIIQYRVAFYTFDVSISISECILFVCARNLAMLIGLTPGSLGTVEILMVLVGGLMSISMAEIVMVQSLVRLVSFVSLLICFPIGIRALSMNKYELKTLMQSTESKNS